MKRRAFLQSVGGLLAGGLVGGYHTIVRPAPLVLPTSKWHPRIPTSIALAEHDIQAGQIVDVRNDTAYLGEETSPNLYLAVTSSAKGGCLVVMRRGPYPFSTGEKHVWNSRKITDETRPG
jgi:hypothetical protein